MHEIRRPIGKPAKDGLFEVPGVNLSAEFEQRVPAVQHDPETWQSLTAMFARNIGQEKAFPATGWIT